MQELLSHAFLRPTAQGLTREQLKKILVQVRAPAASPGSALICTALKSHLPLREALKAVPILQLCDHACGWASKTL